MSRAAQPHTNPLFALQEPQWEARKKTLAASSVENESNTRGVKFARHKCRADNRRGSRTIARGRAMGGAVKKSAGGCYGRADGRAGDGEDGGAMA